jgi:RNA polymerase sigma-70 factor (ECF subfamily)
MPPDTSPDAELVQAAQRNPAAFDEIYRRYVGPVYRYAWGRVHSAEEAEDVTSSTFLEALAGLPTYTEQGRFAAWLFTIARRQVTASARRRRPSEPLADEIPSAGGGAARETRDQVLRGLAVLDETSREAVLLRFFGDLPVRDVAAVLEKGESATKMILHRALARMRTAMGEDVP